MSRERNHSLGSHFDSDVTSRWLKRLTSTTKLLLSVIFITSIILLFGQIAGFQKSLENSLSRHVDSPSTPFPHMSQAWISANPAMLCGTGGTVELTRFLSRFPPSLVIDVGAYDGRDAVAYASGGHRVISFEPSPQKQSLIKKRLAASGFAQRIQFKSMALSNFTGHAEFTVQRTREDDKSQYGSQQDAMFVPYASGKTVTVAVDTLDNVVGDQDILYLKVDAQGHDPEILLGASSLIKRGRIAAITFEVSPKLAPEPQLYVDVIQWLHDMGYQCSDCKGFKGLLSRKLMPLSQMALPVKQYISLLMQIKSIYRNVDVGDSTDFTCFRAV